MKKKEIKLKPSNLYYVSINTQLRVFRPLYYIIKEAVLIGFTNEKICEYLGLTNSFVSTVRQHLANESLIPRRYYGTRNFKYKTKPYTAVVVGGKEKKFEPIVSLVWGVSPKSPKFDPDYFLIPEPSCFWAIKNPSPALLHVIESKSHKVSQGELLRWCDTKIFSKPVEVSSMTKNQLKLMKGYFELYTNVDFVIAVKALRNKYQGKEGKTLGLTSEMFHQAFNELLGIQVQQQEIEEHIALQENVLDALDTSETHYLTEQELSEFAQPDKQEDYIDLGMLATEIAQKEEQAIEETVQENIQEPVVETVQEEKQSKEPVSLIFNGIKITFLQENKEVIVKENSIEIR